MKAPAALTAPAHTWGSPTLPRAPGQPHGAPRSWPEPRAPRQPLGSSAPALVMLRQCQPPAPLSHGRTKPGPPPRPMSWPWPIPRWVAGAGAALVLPGCSAHGWSSHALAPGSCQPHCALQSPCPHWGSVPPHSPVSLPGRREGCRQLLVISVEVRGPMETSDASLPCLICPQPPKLCITQVNAMPRAQAVGRILQAGPWRMQQGAGWIPSAGHAHQPAPWDRRQQWLRHLLQPWCNASARSPKMSMTASARVCNGGKRVEGNPLHSRRAQLGKETRESSAETYWATQRWFLFGSGDWLLACGLCQGLCPKGAQSLPHQADHCREVFMQPTESCLPPGASQMPLWSPLDPEEPHSSVGQFPHKMASIADSHGPCSPTSEDQLECVTASAAWKPKLEGDVKQGGHGTHSGGMTAQVWDVAVVDI